MPVQTFAAISGGEMVSILTILAGMLAGFFAISKMMLSQATKDREADRKERIKLTEAIDKMAENSGLMAEKMGEVARYSKEGNKQSAERNGHLGEQNIQIAELVKSSKEDMLKAVHNVKEQHVEHQTVEKETVNHKK